MRILRVLFFAILAVFTLTGTCFAQTETETETKIARVEGWDRLSSTVADPSPWEKEPETGLWHLERDAPGGKWQIVMAVMDRQIYFTIMIPCDDGKGRSKVYTWKHGGSLAHGIGCGGRRDAMTTRHLDDWIHPLPRDVFTQKIRGGRKM